MLDENVMNENLSNNISELEKQIKLLKEDLNNGVLNVNKRIKDIIVLVRIISKNKKEISFTKEENRKFEDKYNELKTEFKRLKSLHIQKYNEKIRAVNRRFKPLTQKLLDRNLSNDIKKKIKSIPLLSRCEVLKKNMQLPENSYLDKLEYDTITIAELMIGQVESELNIKNDDLTLNINSIANEIDDVLKKMENHVHNDLSLEEINKYLFECGTLSGRLIELSSLHAKMRDKLDNTTSGKFNNIIVSLQKRIDTIKEKLLKEKQRVSEESIYNIVKNELDVLERDYTELVERYFRDEHKCTQFMVLEYKYFMKKYNDKLDKIKNNIKKYVKDNKINQQQLENLNEEIDLITKIHKELDEKLSSEPCVLKNDEIKNNDFLKIEEGLSKLRNAIADLGDKKVKDKDKKKKIQEIIKELENNFKGLDGLLLYQEKFNSDEYKKTKVKYDEYRKELDELRQSYEGKSYLVVKKVREASKVYKKHKKLSLISAGLASMTLLTSAYSLVPALMHGNAMLGSSVPAFKGMMSFFNKILGSMIGASLGKNGAWVLATGVVLNGAVATTSILKFLATLGVGTAVFTVPLYVPQIVLMVKKLVDKIKEYDLKQKLSNTYQSGMKKVNDVASNIDKKIKEYDLKSHYENLYAQYVYDNKVSGVSLDEFCKKKKLTTGDKKVLTAMIAKSKVEDEINKFIGEQANKKGRATASRA